MVPRHDLISQWYDTWANAATPPDQRATIALRECVELECDAPAPLWSWLVACVRRCRRRSRS